MQIKDVSLHLSQNNLLNRAFENSVPLIESDLAGHMCRDHDGVCLRFWPSLTLVKCAFKYLMVLLKEQF